VSASSPDYALRGAERDNAPVSQPNVFVDPGPISRPCRVGKTSKASNERWVGMPCEIIVQLPDGVKNNLSKHT
jgi:hypothetical protein